MSIFIAAVILSASLSESVGQSVFRRQQLHATHRRAQGTTGKSVCLTQACNATAKKYVDRIDQSLDPCDDFYGYSCGKWITNRELEDSEAAVTAFGEIGREMYIVLQDLLSKTTDHMFLSEMKAKLLYTQCKNEDDAEKLRARPLLEILNETLGGWPLLTPDWDASAFDTFSVLVRVGALAANPFFLISIGPDLQSPVDNLVNLLAPTTYTTVDVLKDESLGKLYNETYMEFIRNATVLLMHDADYLPTEEDVDVVAAELNEIFETEAFIGLAQFSALQENSDTIYLNRVTVDELRQYPFKSAILRNITNYIRAAFEGAGRGSSINGSSIIVVPDLNFWDKLDVKLYQLEIAGDAGKRTMANYIGWQLISGCTSYLSHDYRDAEAVYKQKTSGTQAKSEWGAEDRCLEVVINAMPLAVGAMYVREVVSKDLKGKAKMVVDDIEQGFLELLNEADWVDPETQRRAKQKLSSVVDMIAYPDVFLKNISAVNEEYQEMSLGPTFLNSGFDLLRTTYINTLRRIDAKNVRDDPIRMTGDITRADATYYISSNMIDIPVGILQLPFFNAESPQYLNYGGIGFVIGHEITHGFDNTGSSYDENGYRRSWWTNETRILYNEKVDEIIDQYSHYSTPFGNVNGELTAGENVADNGGLRAAFRGYKRYQSRMRLPEPVLPGLEKHTPEQLFFISAAQIWCFKARPETEREVFLTNEHAPYKFRVNGVVSNMKEFSQAFHCSTRAKMNPSKKHVVW